MGGSMCALAALSLIASQIYKQAAVAADRAPCGCRWIACSRARTGIKMDCDKVKWNSFHRRTQGRIQRTPSTHPAAVVVLTCAGEQHGRRL